MTIDERRILAISVALLILNSTLDVVNAGGPIKSGHCPMKETIKSCIPKCRSDFECGLSQRCCPNYCASTSCSEVTAIFSGNDPRKPEKAGVECAGIKCSPGQKCVSSSPMKRPKCT